MRFYAVFKVTTEKHVPLDADNWQDAAKLANTMARPVITKEGVLEVVGMVEDDSLDDEDILQYDSVHEICGPCHKCGYQIIARNCDSELCKADHDGGAAKKKGGWCNTEHGHVQWCSQACRDADRENDCDLELLYRMAGVANGS